MTHWKKLRSRLDDEGLESESADVASESQENLAYEEL